MAKVFLTISSGAAASSSPSRHAVSLYTRLEGARHPAKGQNIVGPKTLVADPTTRLLALGPIAISIRPARRTIRPFSLSTSSVRPREVLIAADLVLIAQGALAAKTEKSILEAVSAPL